MKRFRRQTPLLPLSFFSGLVVAVGLLLAWPALSLAAPGDLDLSFGNGGIVVTSFGQFNYFEPRTVRVQPDGKIVVCGQTFDWDGNEVSSFLARYHPTGALDDSFGTNGKIIIPYIPGVMMVGGDIALQPDGKIITVGYSFLGGNGFGFAVHRYNANGTLDAYDGAVQPDGKILAFGTTTRPDYVNEIAIVRYLGDAPSACPNPIDCPEFFVRQHYLDFLNREPDAGGLAYWTNEIAQCGNNAACIHQRRIGVSAAFFIETEFQETGYFVYRLYRASYGAMPAPNQTRANLTYAEFNQDRANLTAARTSNRPSKPSSTIGHNAAAFSQSIRSRSPTRISSTACLTGAGLTPFTAEREAEINAMNTQGRSRAQVLRNVLEQPALVSREYNPAFVLTQYFGYLRRDPDQTGFDFWLNAVVNSQPNNYRGMVCAFLTSTEYQVRFSNVVTRSNADCGP